METQTHEESQAESQESGGSGEYGGQSVSRFVKWERTYPHSALVKAVEPGGKTERVTMVSGVRQSNNTSIAYEKTDAGKWYKVSAGSTVLIADPALLAELNAV